MGKTSELFAQINSEIELTKEQVSNGEISYLDGLLYMRGFKKELEHCQESIKNFEEENMQRIAEEATAYGNVFKGFEIKEVQGRKMYDFKKIPDIQIKEKEKKELEEKYKSAFDGFQKGTVQTTNIDGELFWIDENGEIKPFPELKIGKSFLSVKEKK